MSYDKNVSPVGWYIASYILRFIEPNAATNEDPEARFRTWTNTILIKAASLDEAYDKVVVRAALETEPYKVGERGIDVQWVFEGITEILPIYEEIEDGSEINLGRCHKTAQEYQKAGAPQGAFIQ